MEKIEVAPSQEPLLPYTPTPGDRPTELGDSGRSTHPHPVDAFFTPWAEACPVHALGEPVPLPPPADQPPLALAAVAVGALLLYQPERATGRDQPRG